MRTLFQASCIYLKSAIDLHGDIKFKMGGFFSIAYDVQIQKFLMQKGEAGGPKKGSTYRLHPLLP